MNLSRPKVILVVADNPSYDHPTQDYATMKLMKSMDTMRWLIPSDRDAFTELMSLYEHNYGLLLRLAPDLDQLTGFVISRTQEGIDLYLKVIEQCRYTTTMSLSYCFLEDGQPITAPDLIVRVYYDARLAEAMDCRHPHGFDVLHQGRGPHKDRLIRKWRINQFLSKWLEYCLTTGHCFSPHETSSTAAEKKPETVTSNA